MELNRVIGVRTAKTVFKAGDKVIKMFEDDYSKSDILNEALNQSRIEDMGINSPKILEVTKLDGKWVIIQELINGKPLDYLINSNKDNKDKQLEYIKALANLQMELHLKKPPLMNKLTDTLTRKIAACELVATVRYDIIAQLKEMPKGNSLCHGDFTPGNIILSEDNKYYFIDFSHSCVGNPLADVAKSYISISFEFSKELGEAYVDYYCEKSVFNKEDIEKWIPIVAASQLSYSKEKEKEYLFGLIKSEY